MEELKFIDYSNAEKYTMGFYFVEYVDEKRDSKIGMGFYNENTGDWFINNFRGIQQRFHLIKMTARLPEKYQVQQ